MVQGEIQCYTILHLDNSKVHILSFLPYLKAWKLMVTTLISFLVLFQSSEFSNSCIFKISLYLYSNSFRQIIFIEIRGSNSDDLE